jgi:hypothetical protein
VFCSSRHASPQSCVSFTEASKHVGTAQCVSGTVLHVGTIAKGVTVLDFCKDARACPLTVIVFPSDIKKMGYVRQLEGQQIEIKGTIQDSDERAQILRHTQQLGESAFRLYPAVPTDYDVERQGHNSAGKTSHPKTKKTTTKQGTFN